MKASTAIILVVTLFAMLIAGGGGALLVASQADTALPATPVNVNNTLSRDYPVETDPLVANRDCTVENAVYKDAESAPCVGEDGTVLDGTVGKCGSGTVTRILDPDESAGFVPASGTGTCDILETTGECQVPCPVDCSGGAWIDGQSCLRTNSDGSTTTLVDGGSPEDGTCGQGQMTRTRNTDTDDFVRAIGLGSCTLITSVPCSRTCANGEVIGECGYSGIKIKDREIGSTVLGHKGCVKKDASNKPVKDEDGEYVPVEVGGTGLERWYEAAVYGDTAKCEDLVQWKTCQGPPTPIDCVGDWLDQDPNTAGAQEWSACKLPEGEVCGATYREKQYHITTPQGTRTVGGVSIPNGEACSATVTVDGQDETRTMESGVQLTFTEWCGESKKVGCCEKSNWVLDEVRGCALDADGENPTKRYTRTVTGACDPDEDPHGNALEKFVECCFEGGWSVPDGATCNTAGKIEEIQTVIGDACTNDQRDSANKVRYEKDCCYESGWTDDRCTSDGKIKEVQTVVGLGCTNDQMKLGNKERYEKDCCYESGWSVVPNSCRSDGKKKEVQTVVGSDEVCEDWQKGYDNTVRHEKDCCYKSGWFVPDGATCNTSGKKLEKQIVKGAECTSEELGDTERYEKDCCYDSGWSVPSGQKCSLVNGEGKMKEVRTLTGMECEGGATVQHEKDCCYMGEWGDVSECNVQGKQKREREVVGTTCNNTDNPKVEWLDCCYEGGDWRNEGTCVARGQKQKQTVVGTDAACSGVDDTRWIDCCEEGAWQDEGTCTNSGQKQTREVSGNTCNDTYNPTVQWVGCCVKGGWTPVGRCGEHRRNMQKKTRTLTAVGINGTDCTDVSDTTYSECTEPTDCVGDWHDRSVVRDERCVFFQCLDWKDAAGKNGKVRTIYQEYGGCGWPGYPDCWEDTEGGYEYKVNGWDDSVMGKGKYPGTHVLDVDGTIPTATELQQDRDRKWPQSGEKRDNEKRKKWTKKGVVKGKQVKKDTWEVYKISTQAANGGYACPHDDGDVRNFTAGDWGPDQDGICRGEESQGTCTDDRPVCENKVQHHGTIHIGAVDDDGWEDTDWYCKISVENGWRGCDPQIMVEDGTTRDRWGNVIGVKGRKQIWDHSQHSIWNEIRWKCPKSCAINPDCQMDQSTNWDNWDVKF